MLPFNQSTYTNARLLT